jgi:hypothetical protein
MNCSREYWVLHHHQPAATRGRGDGAIPDRPLRRPRPGRRSVHGGRAGADRRGIRPQVHGHDLALVRLRPAGSKTRQAILLFPAASDVYGLREVFNIAYFAELTFHKDIKARGYAHLPDIQSYLREEMNAAMKLLDHPQNRGLWTAFCTPELVTAVRSRQIDVLRAMRQNFRNEIHRIAALAPHTESWKQNIEYTTTSALAWAILVESALLTDQLVEDMKRTASDKGCHLRCEWLPYFLPTRLRRPARRSTITSAAAGRSTSCSDPAVEEQNIADAYSRAARCNARSRSPSPAAT